MGNATSDLFDPLVATVSELQKLLKDFEVTTIQLVETYLEEIETNNGYIHAVISTAPQELMLEQAKKLDQERGQDLYGRPYMPFQFLPRYGPIHCHDPLRLS